MELLLVLLILAAQTPATIDYDAIREQKIVKAVRITEKITLDGSLEEPAWKLAIPATDFIQWSPRHGEPSPERTEVRFLYDDDNLYVGFTCFDSDMAHVVVKELKEDFNFQDSDGAGVTFDSLHDLRSGLSFGTNVAGAKRDQQISNDSQFNMDWDGVWDVKVSRNSEAWFAEFMIPFKTLRFSKSRTQEWGVNMNRRILRRNEESLWSPVPLRYRISRVSQAGTLTGLENIRQGRNLKVTPFITAGVTQTRTDGNIQTLQSLTRLKDYDGGVDAKYSLTPSLTLDATYRTDFAQVEVDQQQVNLTRFNLFFPEKRDFFLENAGTFSFGPGGNLVPFFSRRIGLNAAGTPIPIVGGGRVSGKVNQYDIGLIAMKTERLGATPSNNYLVGRLKRNLLRNSWIGTLVTNRDSSAPGDYNRVYGSDAHFQFYNKLEFDSYVLRSDTPNKSGKNQARRFQSGWRDEELTISGEYNSVETNFNPEVGFVRRKNNSQYSGDFAWKPQLKRSNTVRNLYLGTNVDYFKDSERGRVETRTQDYNLGILFENNASINFAVTRTFDRLMSAFDIRPDISIPAGDYTYRSYYASFSTPQNRKMVWNGYGIRGEFWDGHRKSLGSGLGWNPNHHFGLNLNYSRDRVDLPEGSFTTDLVGSRFVYAFTPRAFLNAFVQYNADTQQVSSNIRLDLTHRPLSHLYIVYNDRRDTVTGQLVERALIIKLTNLFNF